MVALQCTPISCFFMLYDFLPPPEWDSLFAAKRYVLVPVGWKENTDIDILEE